MAAVKDLSPSPGAHSRPARRRRDGEVPEWVLIEPGIVVVATRERAWLYRPSILPLGDPFLLPMSGPGSIASTRKLLDSVIGLAARRAPQHPPSTCCTGRQPLRPGARPPQGGPPRAALVPGAPRVPDASSLFARRSCLP